MDTLPTAVIN